MDVVFLHRAYKDPAERVRTRSGTPVPVALGIESRVPGFEPYLQFVMDVVFLRFGSRAYKDPTERVHTRSGTPVPVPWVLSLGSLGLSPTCSL